MPRAPLLGVTSVLGNNSTNKLVGRKFIRPKSMTQHVNISASRDAIEETTMMHESINQDSGLEFTL